jgi:disulfide bond formation protein DsbB
MTMPGTRTVALVCALAAGFALGLALASEYWGGLVPCALCLLECWSYRVAIVLALLALVVHAAFRGLAA